eukprot:GHVU01091164.1.p1 GENE.GHVU01091164.1~~GHVU01091164.1.p1  ORF type:complete len:105 (+),score=5.56 GHVU01091164.1:145-459(+)
MNYLPYLILNLPGDPVKYQRGIDSMQSIMGWTQDKLDERRRQPERQEGDYSFIAEFIRMQEKEKDNPDSLYTGKCITNYSKKCYICLYIQIKHVRLKLTQTLSW